MVVISETSDAGFNGGDQNKIPKEEDNRNKKLKEKVKVSYSLPIPDELILSCFVLVRRCHYPSLSLVCNSFRRLMPKLYDDRLRLGYTESVLYAYVGFPPAENPRWYILHRKPYRNLPNTFSLRLGKIDTLPRMPWGSAVVTIGSKMYVIGGCVGDTRTSNVTLIDCKSHTSCSLTSMKVARSRAAAGVIDGKIYVIGGCESRYSDWAEAFDLEAQIWNPVPCPDPNVYGRGEFEFMTYAVMKEKIYCLDIYHVSSVYDPKDARWDFWDHEMIDVLWNESSCVIDHLLFSINPHFNGFPVNIYDPEQKTWSSLKGLQGFPDNIFRNECKLANFGGKLVILGSDVSQFSKYDGNKREIWFIEIAWERKEDGAFWGKVESVAVVLTPPKTSSVELCRTVTV